MTPYRNVSEWFDSLPEGEVREVVEPLLHLADRMFVMEAAIQSGSLEIIAECKAKLKEDINEFYGWEAKE